jgi:hypothetical protein
MKAILAVILAIFSVYGCCGATTPSSSSCQYGTYGSTCTAICSSHPEVDNCFTTCMDGVRSEGLGDATTCCKQTFRMQCDSMCADLEKSTQGDTTKAECMEECFAADAAGTVPLDLCWVPV